MPEQIRVVLVDDDPLVRAGLRMILGGAPDIAVAGEADDGQAGVTLIAREQPDVALMDVRMPRMDGIEATRRLAGAASPTSVIVLTTFDADDLIVEALRAGACGFLLKDTPPERIVEAVRTVVRGEPILSPQVTSQLINRVTSGADHRAVRAHARLAGLTVREREVADAVGEGLSNAQIAARLFMSVPTVKTHVGRLFDKLGVTNRVQIALLVRDARND